MRLIDADKINWELNVPSKNNAIVKAFTKEVVDHINNEPTVKAIPLKWIENYIWGADTHEEKRALRKMYIQWEEENETY